MTKQEKARRVATRMLEEILDDGLENQFDGYLIYGDRSEKGVIRVSDLLPDEDDLGGYVNYQALKAEARKVCDAVLAAWETKR